MSLFTIPLYIKGDVAALKPFQTPESLLFVKLFWSNVDRVYKKEIWLLHHLHCVPTPAETVWHYKPMTLIWFVKVLFPPDNHNLAEQCLFVSIVSFQSDLGRPVETSWLTLTAKDNSAPSNEAFFPQEQGVHNVLLMSKIPSYWLCVRFVTYHYIWLSQSFLPLLSLLSLLSQFPILLPLSPETWLNG